MTASSTPIPGPATRPAEPATALPPAPPRRDSALRRAFCSARATFDEGESTWFPLIAVALGYAIVIPLFVLMLALATAGAHFAG